MIHNLTERGTVMSVTPWQWVNLLYGDITPPEGAVAEYRLLDPHPDNPARALVDRVWLQWPSSDTGKPLWGKKKWTQGHVYLGMALRTTAGHTASKGTAEYTHPTHLVWGDLDLKGSVYIAEGLDPAALSETELEQAARSALDDVMSQCEELDIPPLAVVYSGHGLQIIWRRRGSTTVEDTEAFNRGLAKVLELDPVATDQARILRVPGWWHWKNPDRPLEVQLWYHDPEAWVEDAALEPLALYQEQTRTGEVVTNNGAVADADLERIGHAWADMKGKPRNGYGRHYLALWTAAWLRSNGYAEADALEVVRSLACSAADEELSDRLKAVRESYKSPNPKGWTGLIDELGLDLQGIAMQAAQKPIVKGAGAGLGGQLKVTAGAGHKLTLLEMADLFLKHAKAHGWDFAFHEQWERWFRYQGGVYVEVHDNTMRKCVDQVLQGYGFTDLTRTNLAEILLKVSHKEHIGKPKVDQGNWELNVRNGILDLRTLELRPHSPEYFSVVQAACDWDPQATSPAWADFLTTAVPDQPDRLTLQKFCGYALTGDTSAQKALLLIGEGGTGKSTFTSVVAAVLGGSSAHSLATSSAIENIRDGSFLVGNLVGKRLCVVSELPKTFDWLPFKRIVGEDPIGVDVKNKTPFVTKLDTKLIVLSNVLPYLADDASNGSLTRRFLPIAFNVKPQSPDPTLESRLIAPESLAGILTWMVKGLRDLQDGGMQFAGEGSRSLEREILEQSNRVIAFLGECAVPAAQGSTANKQLWDAYIDWCSDTRHRPVSSTRFGLDLPAALKVMGWKSQKIRRAAGYEWTGFVLKGRGMS